MKFEFIRHDRGFEFKWQDLNLAQLVLVNICTFVVVVVLPYFPAHLLFGVSLIDYVAGWAIALLIKALIDYVGKLFGK